MAGVKYHCNFDDTDCTIETLGVCTKFCDPYDRAYATNHPGSCGYRESNIVRTRNERIKLLH